MPSPLPDFRIAFFVWSRVQAEGCFAADAMADIFRSEEVDDPRVRGEVAETVYGLIHNLRRIDFALETAGVPVEPGPRREALRFAAFGVLSGRRRLDGVRHEWPGIAWEKVARVDERIAAEKDPVRRLALRRSLPDFLASRLVAEFGESADALAASLSERAPQTLRVNLLKGDRDAVLKELEALKFDARPTHHSKTGVMLRSRTNLFELAAFREGRVDVQDEASQLVAEVTAPAPRSLVIDFCAGAGGKTLALGALMRNTGRLLALDIHSGRLDELRRRARRAELFNSQAIAVGANEWPAEIEALRNRADRVLVDAPCSGIGALRRKPEIRWRITPESLETLPAEQESLARRAMGLVKPGGRLIYATCTVLRAENEDVVERLIAGSDFSAVPIKEILSKETAAPIQDASGNFLKLLPHFHGTDGFFAAVLRRKR